MIATGSAAAEPNQAPLPDRCSASDRALIASTTEAQLEALDLGDLQGYAQLSRDMEASLSRACRKALDELSPARTRCSEQEKQQVLSGAQAMMEAMTDGDLATMYALFDQLEKSVSRSCWLAVNRSQHPALLRACTSAELDAIAGLAGPVMRLAAEMLATLETVEMSDFNAYIQAARKLDEQLAAKLSPKCQGAVARIQQEARRIPPSDKSPDRPSFVQDHGGGTYSVPGIGVCSSSSGCMAY